MSPPVQTAQAIVWSLLSLRIGFKVECDNSLRRNGLLGLGSLTPAMTVVALDAEDGVEGMWRALQITWRIIWRTVELAIVVYVLGAITDRNASLIVGVLGLIYLLSQEAKSLPHRNAVLQ